MSALSTDKLSRLPRVQETHSLHGSLERGIGSIPELEALGFAKNFEREFELEPENVRPCIATIYYQGVDSRRDDYGFIIGCELNHLGIRDKFIREALINFNTRLSKRLSNSEISKLVRNTTSGRYNAYKCTRPELDYFCIREACPWRKCRSSNANKGPITSTFFSLGWPRFLDDLYASFIYLGLHQLRQLLTLPPDKAFLFNYRQLQDLTSVRHQRFSKRLEKLHDFGLIEELEIGSKYGTKRKKTKVKLKWPIPDPRLGHVEPNGPKDGL